MSNILAHHRRRHGLIVNVYRPPMANHLSATYTQSDVPQPVPHGPFLGQGYLPSFRAMGSMPEGTDPRLGQSPQELPYYGTYGSTSSESGAQDVSPWYGTYSEGQNWTAPHDPLVMGSLPEVADPDLHQTVQELFPCNTSRPTICEPREQVFPPQHSTSSEEQNLLALRKLWESLSEVEDRPLAQHPQGLYPYGTSGLTGCGREAQDLSQYDTYSEEQTWPALHDLSVTETLSEEADPHVGQPPQGMFPYGTESSSYVPGARDILPQHNSYSAEQTWLGSSSRHDQSLPPRMVQGCQNRVLCTQPGCTVILNKENLTRHINEVHERKIKARCDHCGREFTRPYLKKEHVRQAKCRTA